MPDRATELANLSASYALRMKAYQDLHSAACMSGDTTSAALHAKAAIEAYGQVLAITEERYALTLAELGFETEKVGRA